MANYAIKKLLKSYLNWTKFTFSALKLNLWCCGSVLPWFLCEKWQLFINLVKKDRRSKVCLCGILLNNLLCEKTF